MHTSSRWLAALPLAFAATPVLAQVSDAAGDPLPTYTGPLGADLDIASTNATYNGSTITVWAKAGGAYVWGFDRGAGTVRFPLQAPGVVIDAVVLVRPDGTGSVNRLVGGGSTPLAPGSVTVVGDLIQAVFRIGDLPSLEFAAEDYTWNLWTRGPVAGNAGLAGFAPDNSNNLITTAPEPGALALFALAFARRR